MDLKEKNKAIEMIETELKKEEQALLEEEEKKSEKQPAQEMKEAEYNAVVDNYRRKVWIRNMAMSLIEWSDGIAPAGEEEVKLPVSIGNHADVINNPEIKDLIRRGINKRDLSDEEFTTLSSLEEFDLIGEIITESRFLMLEYKFSEWDDDDKLFMLEQTESDDMEKVKRAREVRKNRSEMMKKTAKSLEKTTGKLSALELKMLAALPWDKQEQILKKRGLTMQDKDEVYKRLSDLNEDKYEKMSAKEKEKFELDLFMRGYVGEEDFIKFPVKIPDHVKKEIYDEKLGEALEYSCSGIKAWYMAKSTTDIEVKDLAEKNSLKRSRKLYSLYKEFTQKEKSKKEDQEKKPKEKKKNFFEDKESIIKSYRNERRDSSIMEYLNRIDGLEMDQHSAQSAHNSLFRLEKVNRLFREVAAREHPSDPNNIRVYYESLEQQNQELQELAEQSRVIIGSLYRAMGKSVGFCKEVIEIRRELEEQNELPGLAKENSKRVNDILNAVINQEKKEETKKDEKDENPLTEEKKEEKKEENKSEEKKDDKKEDNKSEEKKDDKKEDKKEDDKKEDNKSEEKKDEKEDKKPKDKQEETEEEKRRKANLKKATKDMAAAFKKHDKKLMLQRAGKRREEEALQEEFYAAMDYKHISYNDGNYTKKLLDSRTKGVKIVGDDPKKKYYDNGKMEKSGLNRAEFARKLEVIEGAENKIETFIGKVENNQLLHYLISNIKNISQDPEARAYIMGRLKDRVKENVIRGRDWEEGVIDVPDVEKEKALQEIKEAERKRVTAEESRQTEQLINTLTNKMDLLFAKRTIMNIGQIPPFRKKYLINLIDDKTDKLKDEKKLFIYLPNVNQKEFQGAAECWADTTSNLLRYEGYDVTIKDVKNYSVRKGDFFEKNRDAYNDISDYSDYILGKAKGYSLEERGITCSTREDCGLTIDEQALVFKETVVNALRENTPIGIGFSKHYQTIVGIDGDNLILKNPIGKHGEDTNQLTMKSITDLVGKSAIQRREAQVTKEGSDSTGMVKLFRLKKIEYTDETKNTVKLSGKGQLVYDKDKKAVTKGTDMQLREHQNKSVAFYDPVRNVTTYYPKVKAK